MKIILFGSNGQVGTELLRTLAPMGEIVACDQKDIDLTNQSDLREVLYAQAPHVIVNAAAYTAVDKAESEEAIAFAVNATAVQIMADYARYNGSLLVHYSTDYVFDGENERPYVENDVANPLNVYGKSKRAGEEAVQQGGCHHLIFRTSWVYSAHGSNFIKTILRLAQERDALNIVADQIGAPTSAELIADISALAIAGWQADMLPEGMYHLTASGETSWHGLASYVLDRAIARGMTLKLDASKIYPIATEAYPLPAIRPKNSRLDNGKLTQHLGFSMPDWRLHVDRAIDRLVESGEWKVGSGK